MINEIINTQSGERLSFYKLLSQKKYRVVIPILQRDYAQGRTTSREVRDSFIDALFKYLSEGKPNRDLDFVYGSLLQIDGLTDFIPLDGQQRLTTLFLLHWYLYQNSTNIDSKTNFINAIFRDGKAMFTYETRSSSSEFCNALLSNPFDIFTLLDPDKDKQGVSLNNELSKTIKNSFWFYLSWQYDPTIQAMLTMLDSIHKKFNNCDSFFDKLIDLENPVITFLFLNLKEFKLTDDLYIKMNSRGKPLTPFENFKAKFEKFLETLEMDRTFTLDFNSTKKEVTIKDYFSYNIDTKWANLFWKYRTLQTSTTKGNDTFDEELMNFIRVVFTSQYSIEIDISQKEKDPSLEYLLGTNVAKKEADYSDVITYYKYKDLGLIIDAEDIERYLKLNRGKDRIHEDQYKSLKQLSANCVLNLIGSLDCLTNGNDKIRNHISESFKFYYNESETFENALKHNFESNHQRLCFHAYLRYLIVNNKDYKGIDQWMRVIHNLTHPENTIIDNAFLVAKSIKSIEALIPHSNNILDYLRTNPDIDFFSNQVMEEKIKSHLITKNDSWKSIIEAVEKHKYFNGQIGFILEFAGIIHYYKSHNNCDWTENENNEYYNSFSDYADKASIVFKESYEKRINDEDFVFERAVLTKGDYLTEASQYRWNLLSTNIVKNNIKRDHSWKRLLRSSDDEWSDKRQFVKQVFDDARFDKNNLINSLSTICNDRSGTWRDYFVEFPALLQYCNQGFIRFESDENILLYGESQSNQYHVELYTYYFWLKYIEPYRNSFMPFKETHIDYMQVKSIEESAHILFDKYCLNRIYYQIKIYFDIGDFKVVFTKTNGHNLPENYGDDIKNLLKHSAFSWSYEDEGYTYTLNSFDDTFHKLKDLTKKLNNALLVIQD